MPSTYIDLQPFLSGKHIELRPLTPEDYEPLFQVANDPLIWEQHPSPLRYQRDIFDSQIFSSGLASKTTLVVVDKQTSKIIGSSRYYDVNSVSRELAIGFTFLARAYWGGVINREIKSLMLAHAFTWANRIWFHVACQNIRSCKALEKIGAVLSHTSTRAVNGLPVEYHFYYINS